MSRDASSAPGPAALMSAQALRSARAALPDRLRGALDAVVHADEPLRWLGQPDLRWAARAGAGRALSVAGFAIAGVLSPWLALGSAGSSGWEGSAALRIAGAWALVLALSAGLHVLSAWRTVYALTARRALVVRWPGLGAPQQQPLAFCTGLEHEEDRWGISALRFGGPVNLLAAGGRRGPPQMVWRGVRGSGALPRSILAVIEANEPDPPTTTELHNAPDRFGAPGES